MKKQMAVLISTLGIAVLSTQAVIVVSPTGKSIGSTLHFDVSIGAGGVVKTGDNAALESSSTYAGFAGNSFNYTAVGIKDWDQDAASIKEALDSGTFGEHGDYTAARLGVNKGRQMMGVDPKGRRPRIDHGSNEAMMFRFDTNGLTKPGTQLTLESVELANFGSNDRVVFLYYDASADTYTTSFRNKSGAALPAPVSLPSQVVETGDLLIIGAGKDHNDEFRIGKFTFELTTSR